MSKQLLRDLSQQAHEWKAPRTLTRSLCLSILECAGTPRAQTIYMMLVSKQHDDILDLVCDPHHYNDPTRFRDDLLVTSLLSKASFLKTSHDREANAIKKHFLFEERCGETNRRFIGFSQAGPTQQRMLSDEKVRRNVTRLMVMSRKIASILGPCPYSEILKETHWGPGTSLTVKGKWANVPNKFRFENGCTSDSAAIIGPLLAQYPRWNVGPLNVLRGNVLSCVLKNAKSHRTMSAEPGLNIWFQLAIGTVMKRSLRHAGIDLRHQDRNQLLASFAALFGRIATVDFSSASDSNATELVRFVFPPDWFSLLDAFRCKQVKVNGTWYVLNKFSSMGNGFTFELESLIFYAMACAVCSDYDNISVFGDDVILPVDAVDDFQELSEFCGFTFNKEKSFSTSYYRESCGSHFFHGKPVKPLFLKEQITTLPDVFRVINYFKDLGIPKYQPVVDLLTNHVPVKLRFYGPKRLENSVIHDMDLESTSAVWDRDLQCWKVLALSYRALTRSDYGEAYLIAKLYGLDRKQDGEHFSQSVFTRDGRVLINPPTAPNSASGRGKGKLRVLSIPVSDWGRKPH